MTKNKVEREPLMHIVKRDDLPGWKAWSIRAASIVGGFIIVCLLAFMIMKVSPFTVIKDMFAGAFGTKVSTLVLFRDMAILLIISLAVTPAFKMKFWNIGAEGQVLISAWACVLCMFKIGDKISNSGLIVVCFIAAMAAGIIWAVIPAIFKAKWGTNETLFTLMMNYIAIQIVLYSIKVWVPTGSGVLNPIPYGNLPKVDGGDYAISMIIAAILTVAVFIYLRFSKHGYELTVVGESVNTAKYIGISVPKVIIRTLVLSGAICAIAGFLFANGINHMISKDTVGGQGFTAVLVSWLAQFNPIAMAVVSFVVVFITKGTKRLMENHGIANSFLASVLTGILFLIIIACEFFIRYRVLFRKNNKNKKSDGETLAVAAESESDGDIEDESAHESAFESIVDEASVEASHEQELTEGSEATSDDGTYTAKEEE